jgi:nucleotide-binding universal stress UspA family protein
MYRRILVPIDGSHTAARGLEEAIRLAKNQGARLRLVHVVEEYAVVANAGLDGAGLYLGDLIGLLQTEGKKIVAGAIALAKRRGVQADAATFESFSSRSSDFILGEVKKWRADLIVMGTHGRRGVNRLVLGSDAEIVVRTSPVPVLLVRDPDTKARARKKKAV